MNRYNPIGAGPSSARIHSTEGAGAPNPFTLTRWLALGAQLEKSRTEQEQCEITGGAL